MDLMDNMVHADGLEISVDIMEQLDIAGLYETIIAYRTYKHICLNILIYTSEIHFISRTWDDIGRPSNFLPL